MFEPEISNLQPSTFYRVETRGFPLSDSYFPGLLLERMFIRQIDVDGITFLEFQGAGGSRFVVAATLERVVPLGRAPLLADTLRQPVCEQP
ncbi:hypothetical protein WQE_24267 [Paraburkholderia hospita]|uniref:Uncharacterized protein n=1 Tax=Paraburkholderia hospita TaxID=169430 RepID=A0ABP2PLY2_9BURK|nr:hypothetical protein [Paraburkholderia hospita]EIM98400.1 hypothetical protein WQE_24267 [Paraburkholderia hospita]OUL87831.1 hypothetical protein CA602_12825 [Paraburkholderia hospita]